MNTHLLLASAIMLSGMAAATASAQTTFADDPTVTVVVGDKEAAEDVEIEFNLNQPKRVSDNGLPRFAIVGHDRKFYLGIGAQFLGEGVVDFGDKMPSTLDFVPSSIQPRTPGNGSNLGFTAQGSSFYLNFVGLPGTANRVGLFFKAEFTGPNYGLVVDHLYATYRKMIAGYTNSLFEDGAAIPFTIDNQGPNGVVSVTTFMLGLSHDFSNHVSAGIGLDAPTADITTGLHVGGINQRIPAFPLYLQYGWGGGSHLRASAIIRPLQYRNLTKNENKGVCGWGVQLSGPVSLTDRLTFSFDAVYGQGIANYIQDTNGLNLDALPEANGSGRLKPVSTMGLTAGLTYQYNKHLQSNVIYSHVTNWKDHACAPMLDTYRYGDYVAANLFYNINKIVGFGLEYDYGLRSDFAGQKLHTNRLQAQLAVTF